MGPKAPSAGARPRAPRTTIVPGSRRPPGWVRRHGLRAQTQLCCANRPPAAKQVAETSKNFEAGASASGTGGGNGAKDAPAADTGRPTGLRAPFARPTRTPVRTAGASPRLARASVERTRTRVMRTRTRVRRTRTRVRRTRTRVRRTRTRVMRTRTRASLTEASVGLARACSDRVRSRLSSTDAFPTLARPRQRRHRAALRLTHARVQGARASVRLARARASCLAERGPTGERLGARSGPVYARMQQAEPRSAEDRHQDKREQHHTSRSRRSKCGLLELRRAGGRERLGARLVEAGGGQSQRRRDETQRGIDAHARGARERRAGARQCMRELRDIREAAVRVFLQTAKDRPLDHGRYVSVEQGEARGW